MTDNRGGSIFDKQLAPQLGPGSVARETLHWWQSTFKEELADPNSLNLRFIPPSRPSTPASTSTSARCITTT